MSALLLEEPPVDERELEQEILLPCPHEGQQEILTHEAPNKVAVIGRQFGKSVTGHIAAIDGHGPVSGYHRGALQGARIAWWSLTYPQAEDTWNDFKFSLGGIAIEKDETLRKLVLPGGGSIEVLSAEAPKRSRGPGFDGIVLDEAAHMDRALYETIITPTTIARRAWQMFLTTPNGFNWIQELWAMGGRTKGWASWQRPTADNPLIDPEFLASIRARVSSHTWRQEYLAQFVALAGAVFGDFARAMHVMRCQFDPRFESAFAIDFGYRTFALQVVQTEKSTGLKRIVADREWHEIKLSDALARIKREFPYWNLVQFIDCDPAGEGTNTQTGETDLEAVRAAFPRATVRVSFDESHRDPEWRAGRIRDHLLTVDGTVRIAVDPDCVGTIRMFEQSVYPKHKAGSAEKAVPLKDGINDHLRDAFGYHLVNSAYRKLTQVLASNPLRRGVRPFAMHGIR